MAQEKLREMKHELIRSAAREVPLVDGHAHNLVELDSSFSFKRAFAEAGDDVLDDMPHSIPFKRSVRDIAALYEIDATLDSIEKHRRESELGALSTKCFEAANIDVLLLDDGCTFPKMKEMAWHGTLVRSVHRILRIEAVAEDLLKQEPPDGLKYWNFKVLEQQFLATLKSLASSVVGFKSIAAYRSGLNIDPSVTDQDAEEGLWEELQQSLKEGKHVRLQNKNVIDLLFVRALEVAVSRGIPVQLHTGFGDKDLDLRLSNPLHLRSILEDRRFAEARLVLLHASYPYMREATFLASVYRQVYLDFGLAIPKLTVRGMKTVVAELLELAPINKVMFSTDGYAFPETHFLGAKWARSILAQVLCEAYDDGELSVEQAVDTAQSVLRNNSLAFYKLDKSRTVSKPVGYFEDIEKEAERKVTNILTKEQKPAGVKSGGQTSWLENVKFVRLIWGDGCGQRRCRVVPWAKYKAGVDKSGVGVTKACMGTTSQSDGAAKGSGLSCVGEIRIIADPATFREAPQWGHGLVLVDMHEKPGIPWEYCPRSTLRRLCHLLESEFGLTLRAGFEIEFYLLKENPTTVYEGVDQTSYCSTSGLNRALSIIDSILTWLDDFDIKIDQFHPEGGGGQFEFALSYDDALKSADDLLFAKEAITAAAVGHKVTATFLPKINAKYTTFGSGSHVHLSLWRDGCNVLGADSLSDTNHGLSETGQHFMAGVLHHLPALLGVTAPHPSSYARLQPDTWSGAYHCWGTQNREAPLRVIPDLESGVVNNFELKSFDGCANPHLGLAAVLAAGLDGLRKKLRLGPPLDINPAEVEEGQVRRLPAQLLEAAENLENDTVLTQLLGEKLVTALVAIRKAEVQNYSGDHTDYLQLVQIY